MTKRIVTGLIGLCVLIPVLVFSYTTALEILVALCCAVSIYEIFKCVGFHNSAGCIVPLMAIYSALPFFAHRIALPIDFSSLYLYVSLVVLIYLLCLSVFSHGKFPSDRMAVAIVMIFYVNYGFTSLVTIRHLEMGAYLFWFVFITAWLSDIGAYFVGVLFGRHKLIPDVSPKKTVEGAVGGLLFSVAFSCVYAFVLSVSAGVKPNYLFVIILALVLAAMSQLGDLIASLIKRNYGVKDYGNLLPGHGGILDRFDSIIMVAAVMNILCVFPIFAQMLSI